MTVPHESAVCSVLLDEGGDLWVELEELAVCSSCECCHASGDGGTVTVGT
jgi:hypothetical protein